MRPRGKWTGNVAESVKHLLLKYEYLTYLSSQPNTTKKKIISVGVMTMHKVQLRVQG
jgi:hypothetical protein